MKLCGVHGVLPLVRTMIWGQAEVKKVKILKQSHEKMCDFPDYCLHCKNMRTEPN